MPTLARRKSLRTNCAGPMPSSHWWSEFRLQAGGGRIPGHLNRRPSHRRYRPGETIRQSGIYEVLHDREHRETHEAVMIGGEQFPDCDTCKEKVRFRLVRTAPYIFQDEDFEESGE